MLEEDFTDESASMQALISDLDSFFKSFKVCLSPSTYEAFVAMVTTEISIQMEKFLFKVKFNRVSDTVEISYLN